MAEFAGEGGAVIAAAFTVELGFVLVQPARQVAAEAEAPAMMVRRVRKDM
ncbi:MAG: hypothetical protein ACREDA_10200 [Methylocella sp.]